MRHDSDDPLKFMDRIIAHYLFLDIDPLTKTIVFSDNLTVEVVRQILEYCKGRIKCVFGIGTDLTNNITGLSSLNIVMKLMVIRLSPKHPWIPTVKLSDNPYKIVGDSQAVLQAYAALGIQI